MPGVGSSLGTSTAAARSPSLGVGASAGISTVTAYSADSGAGLSAGMSAVVGVAVAIVLAVGASAGAATVGGAGQAGRWPVSLALRPSVTDDGWAGALSYQWAQLSGPDTATIVSPTAQWTTIAFPELTGAYLFTITVSRADDALVGVGIWRVYVFAGVIVPGDATGAVTLTVNSVERIEHAESVRITKRQGGTDDCTFSITGGRVEEVVAAPIAVFNEVILTRHNDVLNTDVRLFGGVCLSLGLTVEDDQNIVYHPSCVGYAWHLGRVRVTKAYEAVSISAIAAELLAMAPGGITGDYIASGLRSATLAFEDVTIADAFTQLTKLERGLDWHVDVFKRLHFEIAATEGDPVALSSANPLFKNLSIMRDGRQVANRVTVKYDSVIVKSVLVDAEIQVDSLEGYSASGGVTTINGNTITYTGTTSRATHPVYGHIVTYFSTLAVEVTGGGLTPGGTGTQHWLTYVTAEGETPSVMMSFDEAIVSPNNAYQIHLDAIYGDAEEVARLRAVNIYRATMDPPGIFQVGALSLPGRIFVDLLSDEQVPLPWKSLSTENTADSVEHFLTGCSGSQDLHTSTTITEEDTAAQAALAATLGGSDSGIITATLQGGTISEAEARQLARAFLEDSVTLRTSLSCAVRDDDADPGQVVSINFPAPIACVEDLKIQEVQIAGFDGHAPHERSITASTEVVTLEDILRGLT